jgi:MoxR-like ATPase
MNVGDKLAPAPSEPSVPGEAVRPGAVDASVLRLGHQLREVGRTLDARFLDKAEAIRLLLVTLLAGEHMLLVGPPGTAKSALVRSLARLVDARYFEYLLTRFSEPNELFGPVDIKAFREGVFVRRVEAMLPDAEIVFLDEIFKSNSAILNALLSILNERRFFTGSRTMKVPLCSLFGATNEVPNDEALGAIFDRFLVRTMSENLDSFHFHGLVARGIRGEIAELTGAADTVTPLVSLVDIRKAQARLGEFLSFPEEWMARYKGFVFQIRAEGISLSDRRLVKLLKLFASSAILDGRAAVDDGDFFILKHVWNSPEQIPILDDIIGPALERHHRDHPDARRAGVSATDLDGILAELQVIRRILLGGEALSDMQLFSQLRNLQDLRAALQLLGTETARAVSAEVDKLLEGVFESSKWA